LPDGTFETLGVFTSIQPCLVSFKDINLCKSPSAITHKLFGHAGYAWKDKYCDLIPFFGFGWEVELDTNKSCCDTHCYGCTHKKRAGVSQWGIWIKGGFHFE